MIRTMTGTIDPEIIDLSDPTVDIAGWLSRAEALHRAFRPDIPADYPDLMARMRAQGADMALLVEDGQVQAIAVYRSHLTTFGSRFYIDDLVTREEHRGRGYGGVLLAWCEERARAMNCDHFDLESGTHRHRAHGFYFGKGLHIFGFSFRKALKP